MSGVFIHELLSCVTLASAGLSCFVFLIEKLVYTKAERLVDLTNGTGKRSKHASISTSPERPILLTTIDNTLRS